MNSSTDTCAPTARAVLRRALADAFSSAFATHRARTEWAHMDPVAFCRRILGVRLWRAQRDALRLIAGWPDRPIPRTVAIKSGHGVGKTYLGGALVCWWLATGGPGTIVVTSAPTNRQVAKLLWREINLLWRRNAALRALGEPLTRELKLAPDWAAYGFRPREDEQQQLMQGFHAARLRLLIDEANAYPEPLWRAIDTCLTGADAQLVMIGNALVASGRFFRAFADPEVRTLSISCRQHPNVRSGRELIPGAVTRRWIEDFERAYLHSPELVRSRIDAEFPSLDSARGLVPLDWLTAAADVEPRTLTPAIVALDVARYGTARSVATCMRGQDVVGQYAWQHRSLTWTAERTVALADEIGATLFVVDDVGLGGGVTDALRERGLNVYAFVAGARPTDPGRYATLGTEAYWTLREMLEQRMLRLTPTEPLLQQLTQREYRARADRLLLIEPKEEYMRRTGLGSPDEADSLAMAAWAMAQAWREMLAH